MRSEQNRRGSDATLRDVARTARVSLMTVSNVVNGRFELMRPETRSRVEQAIAKLNYRPFATARSLRLERNFCIGLLIVDPLAGFLADPFISQVVAGLSNRVGEQGYGCLVHGVTPDRLEESIFLKFARTDGLCVFLCGSHEQRHVMLKRLLLLNEPIVAIEDTNIGLDPNLAVVRQNDRGAAAELTRILLSQGAKSFLVLIPEMEWPAVTERLTGIREALSEHGLLGGLRIGKCGAGSVEEGQRTLEGQLADHGVPSAIIAVTDRLGIATTRTLSAASLDTGRVLLGGFNASDFWSYPGPTMATVFSNPYAIGVESAGLLIERIKLGKFPTAELILPVRVRDRLS